VKTISGNRLTLLVVALIFLIWAAPVEINYELQTLFQNRTDPAAPTVKITNFFNLANLPEHQVESMLMPSGATSPTNEGLFARRQLLPGKYPASTAMKQSMVAGCGFFYPAMVITLFFSFYQNARNDSDELNSSGWVIGV